MSEMKRIEVKKLYVGSAALFGLLYGLVLGVILGIVLFIMVLMEFKTGFTFFSKEFETAGILAAFIVLISSIVGVAIISCITMIIGALLYNFVAILGGRISLGLAEHEDSEIQSSQGQQINQSYQGQQNVGVGQQATSGVQVQGAGIGNVSSGVSSGGIVVKGRI